MSQPIQPFTSSGVSKDRDQTFVDNCINFFPAMVFTMDLGRGEVISVNDKLREYLDFHPADFGDHKGNLSALICDDDQPIFADALREFRALQPGGSYTFTARFNKKGGGCRHIKTTGHRVESPIDLPVQVFCISQDVTELVKKDEEARTIRQLFDETENLILFGTWSWIPSKDMLEWTDGMYQLLEYSKEELPEVSTKLFMEHVLPEHAEELRKAVNDAVATGTGLDQEFMIRTRNGNIKYVHTKGKVLSDSSGKPARVLGITRDVTLKKNFEKELERYIRDLNRSNKELEEFAYVASHDMHEPLRKILTFSERLKTKYSEALGEEGKIYLERIGVSAGNMRNLIDNLLEFSRVSRGARSFESCDLKKVVSDVLADQELRIEETSTQITLEALPVVEAVPTEMRQLFNNLISNALKFRNVQVTPSIKISARKLTLPEKSERFLPFNRPFYRIDVADNGIGFDPVYAEKIFEIFQRLHGKSEYSGSGIGLSICKKIVENHGGLIFATGNPGSGSTFSVILPEKQTH
jgi:PAS domain S-box-containing protein